MSHEEGFTIKEILSEMRKENRDNFNAVNAHLGQLNGKVATHVQLIAELKKSDEDQETRIRRMEERQAKHAVMYAIIVFFAVIAARFAFDRLVG
jgi:predicted  nucleic acid-binding Zn-ribbon protein